MPFKGLTSGSVMPAGSAAATRFHKGGKEDGRRKDRKGEFSTLCPALQEIRFHAKTKKL